jgi:hypothetical protein
MAFGLNPAVVDSDNHGELICPCGNGGNIHQGNTTIFECGEDPDTVTVIAQDGHNVQATKFPARDTCNPSPRRHGMLIEFTCEQCSYNYDGENYPTIDKTFRLAIFQHKGNTFMEWVD